MLPRPNRLTRGDDYRRVVRTGARSGGSFVSISMVVSTESDATRFGFIVSKAVGGAVLRNRIRRQLKAITYALIPQLPAGVDIVIRANPAAASASFSELDADVGDCVARALRSSKQAS